MCTGGLDVCVRTYKQCCRAKTFCFRSGSDFQKVSAPAPAPAPAQEPAPTLAL
jgi:hypothetical protein